MSEPKPPLPAGAKPLVEVPDLSPEARRKEALRWRAGLQDRAMKRFGPGSQSVPFLNALWSTIVQNSWTRMGVPSGRFAWWVRISNSISPTKRGGDVHSSTPVYLRGIVRFARAEPVSQVPIDQLALAGWTAGAPPSADRDDEGDEIKPKMRF